MNFFSAFLGFLSLKELLKSNNNKKIVFFSESKNYRNYLINLMKSFEDKEDISVIYLTSDIKDNVKISDKINPVFIGSGFF
jgi:vacuolar-type H+-ATPase subunit F/Vma7